MGSGSLSQANPLNLSPGPLFSDFPVIEITVILRLGFPFSWISYLELEWLDHMMQLCLTSEGTAKLVSRVTVPFYPPNSNAGDSSVCTSLTTLIIVHLLDCSHLSGCEVITVLILFTVLNFKQK